ncbi:hypothetical protein [Phytoactinopolyspora endophytica]|uniref:hypothetical protein n=1 Tax=Phytoactinopolyspora endophytica TaxID=1642495 RepID=UPI00101D08DE|nr:hypothetical protein [Phytoactinopolyspora endophytica]
MGDLPANPLAIELTLANRELWWQTKDTEDRPEYWKVSADVWDLEVCPDEHRHVGDLWLAVAELNPDRCFLDMIEPEQWVLELIAETVLDLASGTLVSELDDQISDGVPRMVILSRFQLDEVWRGFGLAGPLIASTLERFSNTARLGVCHVSPAYFMQECPDRISAELTCVRLGELLGRVGFHLWKDVHVVDLRDRALIDAGLEPLQRWGPCGGQQ